MSKITETATWHPDLYQLEVSDPDLAGPVVFAGDGYSPVSGHLNAQAKLLADRTQYLKTQIEDAIIGQGGVSGPGTSINNEVALFDGITGQTIKGGGLLGTAAFTSTGDYATPTEVTNSLQEAKDYADTKILGNAVNVKQFGAVGDGVTDDQPAFEAALSASDSVYVPPGKYLIGTGNLDVTRKKLWAMAGKDAGALPYGQVGATIYTTQTTNPVFILGNGGVLDGLQFYYPNQDGSTITDVSAYPTIVGNPITYPATIKSTPAIVGFELRNLGFINAYNCIEIGDSAFVGGSGRGTISNCDAFPIKSFLTIWNVHAEIIVSDFVLSPIVFQSVASVGDAKLRKWSQQNSEHFILAKADGLIVDRGTTLGANISIHTKDQLLSLARFSNILFDQARTVLKADHNLSNVTFCDCQVYGGTIYGSLEPYTDLFQFNSAVGVGSNGAVIFDNVNVQNALGRIISLNTQNCVSGLTITSCDWASWAQASSISSPTAAFYTAPAFTGARISFVGNQLRNGNLTYGVGINLQGASSVVICGNRFTNNQTCIIANVGTFSQVRIYANSSENTQGTACLNLVGAAINERVNKWAKPATVKVSNDPWFVSTQSNAQATSGATPLTIVFPSKSKDNDEGLNATTGVFTCKTPGCYTFKAQLTHTGATVGDVFFVDLATPLGTYRKRYTVKSALDSVDVSSPLTELRVGDTAMVNITRSSGTGVFTLSTVATENFFSGRLID